MDHQSSSIDLSKLALPFPEKEIEWRISRAGKKGNGQVWATVLAYVSARAIMNRLDEVCGPENWRVRYEMIPGADQVTPGVICQLSIKVGGEWVTKEDGAEQTDVESFKGGISSALKRAGSTWGIGRYLYDLEEGFAELVEQGRGEARYAKNKGKDGSYFEFYWVPPKLPQWALPEGDIAAPQLPRVVPAFPAVGDGFIDPNPKPQAPRASGNGHKKSQAKIMTADEKQMTAARTELGKVYRLYLSHFTEEQAKQVMFALFGVESSHELSLEQLEELKEEYTRCVMRAEAG